MRAIIQRQPAGNLCQRRKVEFVGLQGAVRRLCAHGAVMHQRHVAPGPLQAVLRAKPQTFGADIKAVGALPACQPPDNGCKLQRPQLDLQPGVHLAQVHICHPASEFAPAHIGPGPKRTMTPVQLDP